MTEGMRQRIEVSPEMITLIGGGSLPAGNWPANAVAMAFTPGGGVGSPATVRWIAAPTHDIVAAEEAPLVFIVAKDAIVRLFGEQGVQDGACYHISSELRAIAIAIRDCALPLGAADPYRLAKSIELLCDTMRLLGQGALVPLLGDAHLSQEDSRRILAARRMIDEQWAEKLTLEKLARACGLNRAKLTRGFREMYDCSIADALSQHRLEEARRMLLATDLSISSIGYRCGYLNNASFTRAFSRRFGLAPTQYRAGRLAA